MRLINRQTGRLSLITIWIGYFICSTVSIPAVSGRLSLITIWIGYFICSTVSIPAVSGVEDVGHRSVRSVFHSDSSVWRKHFSAFRPETATSAPNKLRNSEDNDGKVDVFLVVLVAVSFGVMAFIIVMLCALNCCWRKDSRHPQDQSLLGANTKTNSPDFCDVTYVKM